MDLELNEKNEGSLLTFLERTKDGKYVKIDINSLLYSRLKEQAEDSPRLEEEFYYSTR